MEEISLFALPNGSKGDEDAASLCEEVGLEIAREPIRPIRD